MSKSDEHSSGALLAHLSSMDRQATGLAVDYDGAEANGSPGLAIGSSFDTLDEQAARPANQRLAIKAGRRLIFLNSGEIDWIEACGNHVKFHVGRESYLVRAGIGYIAKKLNGAELLRIHRSAIVHLRKIRELKSCDNGDYLVTLKDGKQLPCSRGYKSSLLNLVKSCYSI